MRRGVTGTIFFFSTEESPPLLCKNLKNNTRTPGPIQKTTPRDDFHKGSQHTFCHVWGPVCSQCSLLLLRPSVFYVSASLSLSSLCPAVVTSVGQYEVTNFSSSQRNPPHTLGHVHVIHNYIPRGIDCIICVMEGPKCVERDPIGLNQKPNTKKSWYSCVFTHNPLIYSFRSTAIVFLFALILHKT